MMNRSSPHQKSASKLRARIMPAKEFWTPERLARLDRNIPDPPRVEEFRRIIREVEGR